MNFTENTYEKWWKFIKITVSKTQTNRFNDYLFEGNYLGCKGHCLETQHIRQQRQRSKQRRLISFFNLKFDENES